MKNKENWKVFRIDSIFDMFTGASISQDKFNVGSIPRITATDTNNGIGLFTERLEDRNYRSFQNFIREPLKTPVEHLERQIYL